MNNISNNNRGGFNNRGRGRGGRGTQHFGRNNQDWRSQREPSCSHSQQPQYGNRGNQSSSSSQPSPITTVKAALIPTPNFHPPTKLVAAKPGTQGIKTTVVTNYFSLELPKKPFYQLTIQCSPVVLNPRLLNELLLKLDRVKNVHYITDAVACLFSDTPVVKEHESAVVQVVKSQDGKEYKITLSPSSTITREQKYSEYMHVCNLFYRRALSKLKLTQFGKDLFNQQSAVELRDYQLKILPGLSFGMQYLEKLLFNADVVFRILRTETVWDIIKKVGLDKDKIASKLIGTVALCLHNNKTIRIDEIAFDKTPKSTFLCEGKEVSFADYYSKKYQQKVTIMNQPLMVQYRRGKDIDPKTNKKVQILEYFIPELLKPTGLTPEQRENNRLMQAVKKEVNVDPAIRFNRIMENLSKFAADTEYMKELQDTGIQIDPRFVETEARVLNTPKIVFNKNKLVDPKQPNDRYFWSMHKFFRPITVSEKVLIVLPYGDGNDYSPLIVEVQDQTMRFGCEAEFTEIYVDLKTGNHAKEYVSRVLGYKYALIVLPDKTKTVYKEIKKQLDAKDIISQCIIAANAADSNDRGFKKKVSNTVLALFAKIGAAPWTVTYTLKDTMVIGMDIFHSGEIGPKVKNSHVGFVASIDKDISEFHSYTMKHAPGQEIVDEIATLFAKALKSYFLKNNAYPKNIIVYRDGVGEDQVRTAQELEVEGIKKVLNQIPALKNVNFAYILVVKRIHTRILNKDKNGLIVNPTPGTGVDSVITTNGAQEFFLVSQSVQNNTTAVPVKYRSIYNSNVQVLTTDVLMKFAFDLTHGYYNWMSSIKVPCVCQYAHKEAEYADQTLSRVDPRDRKLIHIKL